MEATFSFLSLILFPVSSDFSNFPEIIGKYDLVLFPLVNIVPSHTPATLSTGPKIKLVPPAPTEVTLLKVGISSAPFLLNLKISLTFTIPLKSVILGLVTTAEVAPPSIIISPPIFLSLIREILAANDVVAPTFLTDLTEEISLFTIDMIFDPTSIPLIVNGSLIWNSPSTSVKLNEVLPDIAEVKWPLAPLNFPFTNAELDAVIPIPTTILVIISISKSLRSNLDVPTPDSALSKS